MEWINFRHLYAFWSVCRYGGFQKASKKILVSQSAISDQVSQLEEYLEVKLLERTTRSLNITSDGADLLEYADEIFGKSAEINKAFKNRDSKNSIADIKIGMVGGISRNFMYRLIIQHLNENDDTNLDIIDGSYEELTQLLKSFEVDLVFSLEVPRKKDLGKLSFKKIMTSPLCVAGKPEIIKTLRSKRHKIDSLNFFLFKHHFEGELTDILAKRFRLNPVAPVSTDDISLLRFLANSGRGIAVLPEIGIQEDLDRGHLSRISLEGLPSADFYATFLKKGSQTSVISDFLSH